MSFCSDLLDVYRAMLFLEKRPVWDPKSCFLPRKIDFSGLTPISNEALISCFSFMNPEEQRVPYKDLSFEFEDKKVNFTISHFNDRDTIILSDTGKIAYVCEVFFPRLAAEYNQRIDFEAKLLFGCENVGSFFLLSNSYFRTTAISSKAVFP